MIFGKTGFFLAVAATALAGCAGEGIYGRNYAGPESPTAQVYPPDALKANKLAIVILSCLMAPERDVDDCEVAYTSAPEYDFGPAAIILARDVVIQPDEAAVVAKCRPGPVPGSAWVRLPIFFSPNDSRLPEVRALLPEAMAASKPFIDARRPPTGAATCSSEQKGLVDDKVRTSP